MINLFAGPVFTEPYWAIIFYVVRMGMIPLAVGLVAYILLSLIYRYRFHKKTLPKKVTRIIVISTGILWVLGFIVYLFLVIPR